MLDRSSTLETLFQRYRDEGDAAALAAIFDRTAPELLRIARHLTGARDAAEDVVQETFLAAIRDRGSFDATRRLLPWLCGILSHRAAEAMRRRRDGGKRERSATGVERDRPFGAPDLAAVESPEASQAERAASSEAARLALAAIDRLPARERALVASYLCDGKRPIELAAERNLPASTIRVQLSRALSRLRGFLPASLVGGLVAALLPSRRLAPVKSNVLAHAFPGIPEIPAASVGASSVMGVLAVKKIAWITAACVATILAVSWIRFDADPSDGLHVGDAALAPSPPPATSPAAPRDDGADRAPVRLPVAEVAATVGSVRVGRLPAAYAAALAGMRGRLLDAGRTPVEGVVVSLLGGRMEELFEDVLADRSVVAFDELVRATSRTDAAGRFEFADLEPQGTFALGIALGTDAATWRIVESMTVAGQVLDLGDFVLEASIRVSGRVVDVAGAPVKGAVVHVGSLPHPAIALALATLTPGVRAVQGDRRPLVVTPRKWIERLMENLPIPRTTTDADGRFAFTAIPRGSISVAVRHAEFAPFALGPRSCGSAADCALGDLVVTRGESVSGVIRDAAGAPLAGIRIAAGPWSHEIDCGLIRSAGTSDASGRFEATLLPEGPVVLVAEVPSGGARLVRVVDAGDELELTMDAFETIRVDVRDATGDAIAIERIVTEIELGRPRDLDAFVAPTFVTATPRLRDDGRLEIAGVPQGHHVLRVTVAGFAPQVVPVRVKEGGADVPVTLHAAREWRVRVLGATADGAAPRPLEHARVVFHDEATGSSASRRSDADGCAMLPLSASAREIELEVHHPAYASRSIELAVTEADGIVVLDAGGRIEGRVTRGGRSPEKRFLVLLESSAIGNDRPPYTAVTADDGAFSFGRVPPGEARLKLLDRPFGSDGSEDPIAGLLRLEIAPPIARRETVVATGETARITIDLARPQGAAAIEGRITRGGAPAGGLDVTATSKSASERDARAPAGGAGVAGDARATVTAPDGSFTFAELDAGAVELAVLAPSADGRPQESLLRASFELASDETRRLDLDVAARALSLRLVRAETGAPIVNAEAVFTRSFDSRTIFVTSVAGDPGRGATTLRTDADGIVVLPVDAGAVLQFYVTAGGARGAFDTSTASALAETVAAMQVELSGARLAGRIVLQPPRSLSRVLFTLETVGIEPSYSRGSSLRDFDGDVPFAFDGVAAGRYRATLESLDSRESIGELPAIEFEVPPGGHLETVLEFRVKSGK